MEPDICWNQNLCPYYGGFSVMFLIRQVIVYFLAWVNQMGHLLYNCDDVQAIHWECGLLMSLIPSQFKDI